MNSETLFKNIFGRDLLEEDSNNYLEQLQNKYPWFALPHFYKLKNTGIGHKDYNKQAALTAQFFPNIFILNQRLQQKNYNLPKETANLLPKHQELEINEPQPVTEPVTENTPVTQEVDIKNEAAFNDSGTDLALADVNAADIIPEHQEHEIDEPQPVIEPVTENTAITQDNDIIINEEASASNSSLEKAAAEFKKEAVENNPGEPEPVLFEPLHATDYFASQGIKLSEELQSQDKLGKQMKSFTDWLKIMKKTPEQQQGLQQVPDEAQIQNLANKSNTEAEILTESMAEVYLQQNKKEKAREIYKKLSLLNPDKSAYFAAKLENLNKN